MDIQKIKDDLKWVCAVINSTNLRVDQVEAINRLLACAERLENVMEGLQNETADE